MLNGWLTSFWQRKLECLLEGWLCIMLLELDLLGRIKIYELEGVLVMHSRLLRQNRSLPRWQWRRVHRH